MNFHHVANMKFNADISDLKYHF